MILLNMFIVIFSFYMYCFEISEPQSGFHIAFNMFDTDGNQRVDKKEFLVVMYAPVSPFYKLYFLFP